VCVCVCVLVCVCVCVLDRERERESCEYYAWKFGGDMAGTLVPSSPTASFRACVCVCS
jgi:hypothetical protein